MGPIAKLVAHGIGLGAEGIAAAKASRQQRKSKGNNAEAAGPDETSKQRELTQESNLHPDEKQNRKAREAALDLPGDDHDDLLPAYDSSEEDDEADWALDDAGEDSDNAKSGLRDKEPDLETITAGEDGKKHYVDKIVTSFISHHPLPASPRKHGQLPCPVILPQRRPQTKSRGFVRAYAPVLEECGIDQAAFLEFLKAMHSSSKASPILHVVNIAAMFAGFVPSLAAMAASIIVQTIAKTAIEIQSRSRSNDFLTQMNEQYFRPRGLYCMVMTYAPESKASHERIDLSQTISHYLTPDESNWRNKTRNLRNSSGKTQSELEMPEAAPLIFPALDTTMTMSPDGKKQNAIKTSGKFFADYYDRRAQAKYTAAMPNSTLAGGLAPQHFASRFSDPNHAVNSGSLVALVSGGHIDNSKWKAGKRGHRMERKAARRGYSLQPQSNVANLGQRQRKGVRRFLKQNVLYLMIVNMPTEEELAAAREREALAKKGGSKQ